MKALVTGATGLVGRRLVASLGSPAVLSRSVEAASRALPTAQVHAWAGGAEPPPERAFEGVDAVFHLAGEPIAAGRWTSERKRSIEQSRVLGTRSLVAAMGSLARPPRVLVSASAIGFYGDRGDEELDESSAPGEGFLSQVCQKWEAEARAAAELGVRVVTARLGMVLAPEGGALPRMLPVFRLGLGGPLGSGRQWMSWVHVDDAVGLLRFAAETALPSGSLNVTAEQPVRNAAFTRQLARACRQPAFLPVPGVALKLALGELSQLLLSSQRVLPQVARRAGYSPRHADLGSALADCLAG